MKKFPSCNISCYVSTFTDIVGKGLTTSEKYNPFSIKTSELVLDLP
jgi:hypothetical protein